MFHIFRNGMPIGAAFSASHRVGCAVAVDIAAHDFSDGLNKLNWPWEVENPPLLF